MKEFNVILLLFCLRGSSLVRQESASDLILCRAYTGAWLRPE